MTKKRRREETRPTIHPKNKYSEKPPDFALLASLYPSFEPFVFYSRDGRPRIDWTDFNATRDLTRILLLHDHGLNWWIPDGQLCPTVPNRSNYIHWLEDLLTSDIIPCTNSSQDNVRGFDIGTGANCIYPLLGSSLLGWRFVGSDVTDVALDWAERNVRNNPQISELIEIRKVETDAVSAPVGDLKDFSDGESKDDLNIGEKPYCEPLSSPDPAVVEKSYCGPPVLYGVVREDETFDFCMCNPPFFESMEEAGLNPKTACGGTPEEMVCAGGEKAFIVRIIEDSVKLKQSFRWYTSMVGRKANLKSLISKLRDVGVTIVKTTEFVQGKTCRWGIAWSFVPPVRKIMSTHMIEKTNLSFMLEGLQRRFGAFNVLQSVESFFSSSGASCKLNVPSFAVDVTASNDQLKLLLKDNVNQFEEASCPPCSPSSGLTFRISVFQQNPGALLVRGSLQQKDSPGSGAFSSAFQQLEIFLKDEFFRGKASIGPSLV